MGGQGEGVPSRELIGLSFYNQRKSGERRKPFLSFLSRCHSPPPGWAGEFSRPYMVKLGAQIIVFYVCREHALGIINLLSSDGQDVSLMAPLFYCLGACLVLLLPGFIAKQA